MSQDCDLDWDFRARNGQGAVHKTMPNVVFCEMDTTVHMKETLRNQGVNSEIWRRIERNSDIRFHVLPEVAHELDAMHIGLPAMGIDFKRVFTIPTDEVYARLVWQAERRCFLVPQVAAQLSDRYAHFHARVALPDEYGP